MVVKRIQADGQISLGEEHAGRLVAVEEVEKGVWIVKLGDFVPEDERWLHEPAVAVDLDRAVRWAEANPPAETDLDRLFELHYFQLDRYEREEADDGPAQA